MRPPSSSPRSRSSVAALLAAALFALPVFVAASTDSDGVVVEVVVAFCDGDLVCDPEESYDACPSDCEPPPPPPEEEDEEEDRPRTSSASGRDDETSRPPRGSTTTPASPTGPAAAGGGISSKPIDPTTRELADTIDVSVGDADREVDFTWSDLGAAEVRVLRGVGDNFPSSPFDGGVVVYEGDGNSFSDVVMPGDTARYAAFVRQSDGAYGARLLIVVAKVEEPQETGFGWLKKAGDSAVESLRSPWLWLVTLIGFLAGIFARRKSK